MAHIEKKLAELGLVLPEPVKLPPDVRLPFALVNVRDRRVFVSGHGPQIIFFGLNVIVHLFLMQFTHQVIGTRMFIIMT